MQPGGLKNGNQNQGTRSEGLEGTKGGERYLRYLQTQAEGAKDSTVTLEKPPTGALALFRHGLAEGVFTVLAFCFSCRSFDIGDATLDAFVSSISNRVLNGK